MYCLEEASESEDRETEERITSVIDIRACVWCAQATRARGRAPRQCCSATVAVAMQEANAIPIARETFGAVTGELKIGSLSVSPERESPALLVVWAYQQNNYFLEEGSFFFFARKRDPFFGCFFRLLGCFKLLFFFCCAFWVCFCAFGVFSFFARQRDLGGEGLIFRPTTPKRGISALGFTHTYRACSGDGGCKGNMT